MGRNKTLRVLRGIIACAACFCFAASAGWLAAYRADCVRQNQRRAALAADFRRAALRDGLQPADTPSEAAEETPAQESSDRFDLLRAQNGDAIAWLSLDAIGLEEPVVAGLDNRHYLRRDFAGEPSRLGTIFLDKDSALGDSLLCLYGHAARDGSMFGSLGAYREAAFLRANAHIALDTPEGMTEWQIAAALSADPGDPDGFFAWQRALRTGIMTPEEFYTRVMAEAVSVSEEAYGGYTGMRFLCLVTCADDFPDARLVVVAVSFS